MRVGDDARLGTSHTPRKFPRFKNAPKIFTDLKTIYRMLSKEEQKIFQERIDAYKRMIRYCEGEIAKLYARMPHERCCFKDARKRLPINNGK
jgi:hypothetical protein